jgi:parallel beta-helix repeat protein
MISLLGPDRGARLLKCAAVAGLFVAAAAVGPVSSASADTSTLYVGGANCSDSGPGTQAQPFCTISEAASVAVAGQTVLVSSGTYDEDVKPANSGTPGSPITFQAAPGATVTVAGGWNGFTISSRTWITISGFTITGTTSSGIYLWNSNNVVVNGNTVTYSGQQAQGENAVGIYVGETSNSTISGNTVDHNSATGIYLTQGSTGVMVAGNEASYNAYGWERNANGIDVISPGNTVIKNVAHNNEDSGIQFYPGGNNNVAADNLSYDNMGITTVQLTNCSHPTTGNTSDCFTGDHGIDDLDVTGNQITGNTVYGNTTAGINVEGLPSGTPSGITIKNNISVDNAINCPDGAGGTTTCPGTKGDVRVDSTSQTGTILDRDVLWLDSPGYLATWGNTSYKTLSAFQAASGQEPNGKQANPGFQSPTWWQNPAGASFQLSACSPAIDMADSGATGEQPTDILGNPRVIDPSSLQTGAGPRNYDDDGAYEYQAPPAAPTLQASANATSVTLTWSGPPAGTPAISSYTIYRGTSAGAESLLATVSGSTTQYTDAAVTPGTTYYYQVSAASSAGSSAQSAEASATPGGVPASPIAFVAASQTSITSGATKASISAPAGIQPGDVMIAWLALGNPVSNFTFGSGWTPFTWSPAVDGTAWQVFSYYKVATAADVGASYTASWANTAKGTFALVAYSGVDEGAPLAGSAALVDNNSSASLTTPSLGPSAATSWAVALYAIRSTTSSQSNNSWTANPALVHRVNANNSASLSSPWVSIAVDDSNAAVSTSPPCTAVRSYTATALYPESHKAAALIYLRQAPAGAGS